MELTDAERQTLESWVKSIKADPDGSWRQDGAAVANNLRRALPDLDDTTMTRVVMWVADIFNANLEGNPALMLAQAILSCAAVDLAGAALATPPEG